MALTVTTWNVENFASTSPTFEAKLDYLAQELAARAPQVIALQEVLDAEAAQKLADRLELSLVLGKADARGNRVAFLLEADPQSVEILDEWRLPAPVQELREKNEIVTLAKLPRPFLHVVISHNGKRISLLNAHLKSKLLTFPGGKFSTDDERERALVAHFALGRRAAEAVTLRHRVSQLLPNNPTIVLGDLNDVPKAATTQILYGPVGSQPRGEEDRERPDSAFHRVDAGDGERLFNVGMLVAEEQRWSRVTNQQRELIDHVLASAAMMPISDGVRRVPVVEIGNGAGPSAGEVPRVREVVPDHAPVTATFFV